MTLTNGQVATDVMHWLGHSSLQMTQSYTHENVRGALNVFDGMALTLLGNSADEKKDFVKIRVPKFLYPNFIGMYRNLSAMKTQKKTGHPVITTVCPV